MNRTDRLTGIILALYGKRQTAARLAERFEVSRRTIFRDIDALCQIGVPVIALPGSGGGFTLAEGYWLPPLNFSVGEAALLLLALNGLGEAEISPFGETQRAVEEKLRATLRPEVSAEADRRLASIAVAPPHPPPDPNRFQMLSTAIRDERWLRVDYHSLRLIATHHLLPIRLEANDGRWYCRAISLEAGEERSYRLDRMQAMEQVATPSGATAARSAASRVRRAYDDPSHPEVVVRLSYRARRLAEDTSHWGEYITRMGADHWELRFRCPPGELAYHAREVHALGPTAEAIAPIEFRHLVRELAMATADIYADDGSQLTQPAIERKDDRRMSPSRR